MKERHKSVYDFDSDLDWYAYLDHHDTSDDGREPDEPETEYHEENDRNYPANDSRWERW